MALPPLVGELCKKREKCGSMSSSLESQKCKRDRERERETQPPHSRPERRPQASGGREGGPATPSSLGLSLPADCWIEIWNVCCCFFFFPFSFFFKSGVRTQGSVYKYTIQRALAGNQEFESLLLPHQRTLAKSRPQYGPQFPHPTNEQEAIPDVSFRANIPVFSACPRPLPLALLTQN